MSCNIGVKGVTTVGSTPEPDHDIDDVFQCPFIYSVNIDWISVLGCMGILV